MQECFDALIAFRPMLFRYASEAADNNEDDLLSQILLINDRLNIAVQTFNVFSLFVIFRRLYVYILRKNTLS